MSYRAKTRSNRKTNKYKTSKNSRASKKRTTTKTSYANKESKDLLSLSPFYSFSSHWSHITRQYLCLSTWGTCMGGINEQYDDIMDQEAAIPLVEDNYKRLISNWHKKKSKYDKYNKEVERYNKEQEIEAMRANQANSYYNNDDDDDDYYNNTNNNNYNTTNIYQQYSSPQTIINESKSIYLSQSHECPEWQYTPEIKQDTDSSDSDSDTSSSSEEQEQENKYKTPATKTIIQSETYNDTNNNNNNRYSGMDADDEEYKHQQPQYTQSIDNKYLLSPKQEQDANNNNNKTEQDSSTETTPKTHSKRNVLSGRSFGRKLDMFQSAVTTKRRMTIEEMEWKESHQSKASEKSFKSHDPDGSQYIEAFSYSPAAHGVQPHMPRKVSTQDFTKHMKKMEDPQAIVRKGDIANASATDKIKLFQMLSTEHSHTHNDND